MPSACSINNRRPRRGPSRTRFWNAASQIVVHPSRRRHMVTQRPDAVCVHLVRRLDMLGSGVEDIHAR